MVVRAVARTRCAANEDVIRTAFIYQPEVVETVGDPRSWMTWRSQRARPLAQTFHPTGRGEEFVVIVNHFKSKSSGTGDNADQGDGQGASNNSREQAHALVDFAARPPPMPTDGLPAR